MVLMALVAAELVAARLWDEFHPVEPKHLDRSLPPITEAQSQSAVDLVRASGIVDRVSGGQAWEVTDVRDHPGIQTVEVYVEWDEPVESNGPCTTVALLNPAVTAVAGSGIAVPVPDGAVSTETITEQAQWDDSRSIPSG